MARPYTRKVIQPKHEPEAVDGPGALTAVQPEPPNPANERREIVYLQTKLEEANRRIEELLAKLMFHQADAVLSVIAEPAIAPGQIPDDDPADPRPEFDPTYGWRTPAVVAWAVRQIEKRKGGA